MWGWIKRWIEDEKPLEILKQGVVEWNAWREENQDVEVDLSNTNLSNINLINANLRGVNFSNTNLVNANLIRADFSLAKLNQANLTNADLDRADFSLAKLNYANLNHANLNGVNLYGASLNGANLNRASLNGANLNRANLNGVNLKKASLNDANLSSSYLKSANLREADLIRIQALNTSLEGATLTGACIQDWNINSNTNFDNVICDYIYLSYDLIEDYTERRPHDPNRIFESGEFAQIFQRVHETLDLYFRKGIDWYAFFQSFQGIQIESDKGEIIIQSIEKKRNGSFVVRVEVPSDVDKGKIERLFKTKYDAELKRIEAQYRERLQFKDEQIEFYRQQSTKMTSIVETLANRPINVEAIAMAEQNEEKDSKRIKIDIGTLYGSANTEGDTTVNVNPPQDLASAAKEIQDLLEQLSEDYPTTTLSEKLAVAEKAIACIKSDENWLGKVVRVIKAMGKETFFEAIDHPAANVLRAGFEELLSD